MAETSTRLSGQSGANGLVHKKAYYLAGHGLEKTSTAIICARDARDGRPVITTDPELIQQVFRELPPRRAEVCCLDYLVDEDAGTGYPANGRAEDGQNGHRPIKLLTRKEFNDLNITYEQPFGWRAGLVDDRAGA